MATKKAVILVNLGSPTAPEPAAVRRFLGQFLADTRVVEIPSLLWLPLLRGVILPLRSKRVAQLYKEIWTEHGSPLVAMTVRQAELLQQSLHQDGANHWVVRHAMTYGKPTIEDTINALRREGIERIVLLPLYPQYSGTTTGAVYDQVARFALRSRYVSDVRIVRDYCYRADYIAALAQSVRDHWSLHGVAGMLLFSFHGIPKACVEKGDPYREHCEYTAAAVAEALGLSINEWRLCFQSRFGKAEWLQPYTDALLMSLPASGVRRVDVICPAFSSDCLETLEEIEVGSRKVFLDAGGEYFERIACLNDRSDHIRLLKSIVIESE